MAVTARACAGLDRNADRRRPVGYEGGASRGARERRELGSGGTAGAVFAVALTGCGAVLGEAPGDGHECVAMLGQALAADAAAAGDRGRLVAGAPDRSPRKSARAW